MRQTLNNNPNQIYYYCLLLATILIFGPFLLGNIGGIHPDPRADFEVYLKVVQAMEYHTLYQSAVDVKNVGFFFFFSLFYKIYSSFHSDLSYIFIWSHSLLSLLFFSSSLFVFHIINNISSSKKWALGTAIIYLLYTSILEHSYTINQPQIAQFTILYLLLKVSDKNFQYHLKDYFFLGIILGLAFIFSTPYFPMILFIPIISYLQNKNLKSWFLNCSSAGIGFFSALLPFFIYFYFNNALADWWYWNVEFLSIKDQIGTNFKIPLLKNIIGMFFTLGYIPQTILNFIITTFTFLIWIFVLIKLTIKKTFLSLSLHPIVIICLLTLWTRIMLEKHHSSYNIYYMPFLIIAPSLFLFFYHKEFSKKIQQGMLFLLIFWSFTSLKFPASFNQEAGTYTYDPKTIAIIKNNPLKTPAYISSAWGSSYSFSTKWIPIGYNVYLSELRFIDKEKPEVILGTPSSSDFLLYLSSPNKYEQQIINNYPINSTILEKNYTQVSPIMYIRNNSLSSWNLEVQNYLSTTPFKEMFPSMKKRLKLPVKIKEFFNKLSL